MRNRLLSLPQLPGLRPRPVASSAEINSILSPTPFPTPSASTILADLLPTLSVSIGLVTLRTVAPARYVAATDPTNGTTLSAAQGLTEMVAVLAGLLGHR